MKKEKIMAKITQNRVEKSFQIVHRLTEDVGYGTNTILTFKILVLSTLFII